MPGFPGRPMGPPIGAGSFDPLSLFANGEDGFYFDFSKTDRLFKESTGQTAVVVDADPAGLALESHSWSGKTLAQLLESQPNLVTNGDFSVDANWTKGAGWSIGGGVAIGTAVTVTTLIDQPITITSGKWYRVSYDIVSISAGAVSPVFGAVLQSGTIQSAVGSYVEYIQATVNATTAGLRARSSAFTGTLDNLAIKEIPGNHATQTTTSARPFWKTPDFIRLDGSDDNLLTTLKPNATFTMAAKFKASTVPSLAMGSRVAQANGVYLGLGSDGKLAVGAGDALVGGLGGADIRNTLGVGVGTVSGSTVTGWWNGASVGSKTQAGAINTTVPLRVGAFNNNGAAVNPLSGDMHYAIAINRILTSVEIISLTNAWGTS